MLLERFGGSYTLFEALAGWKVVVGIVHDPEVVLVDATRFVLDY